MRYLFLAAFLLCAVVAGAGGWPEGGVSGGSGTSFPDGGIKGGGTANTLAMFTGADTIGPSIITQSVDGGVSVTGAQGLTLNTGAAANALLTETGVDVVSGSATTWNICVNTGAGACTGTVDALTVTGATATAGLTTTAPLSISGVDPSATTCAAAAEYNNLAVGAAATDYARCEAYNGTEIFSVKRNGTTTVTGALTVTGTQTVSSTLGVTGTLSAVNAATVGTTLNVIGTTSIGTIGGGVAAEGRININSNADGSIEFQGFGTPVGRVGYDTDSPGQMRLLNIFSNTVVVGTSLGTAGGTNVFEVRKGTTFAGTPGTLLFNVDGAGAGTLIAGLTATTGTFSGAIAANSGSITTTQTTFNLVNATATTLNIGGASATTSIGASTSSTLIKGAVLEVDGVTTSAPTCAADDDVGRLTRYSKSSGDTISYCLCTKLATAFTLTALGTGDCT